MNKYFIAFCVLTLLYSCGSIKNYNTAVTKLHLVEDLHEDVDKVYSQLQRLHPHLYQFTSKKQLDYKFDSLKTAIKSPMTSRKFHKELAKVTKFVRQGHLSVTAPSNRYNRKERKALNKKTFPINNIETEYVEDKLILSHVRGKDSILKNTELLKVNTEDVKTLFKKFKKVVATDGYNKTFHDRVVGKRFLRYYYQDVGRFDSISLTLKNSDSTFIKTYKRILKSELKKATDTVKKDSSKVKQSKKKLTRAEKKAKRIENKRKRKERSKYGYNYATKENTRSLDFIGKDSTVAYMKIKGFSRGDYEPFYEEVFKTLDSLKTETLVIDLRNNFGGRLNEIAELYSYLTDKKFKFINPSETNTRQPILKSLMSNSTSIGTKIFAGLFSPAIITHGIIKTNKKDGKLYYNFKSSKEKEPKTQNFKGKIYVLINGNSFSASSILSNQLQATKRATFVGEETGGAYNGTVAGLYKIYELPNTKIKARIGLMHIDAKYKTEPDGFGVKPDVAITPLYKDRLNNIDTELEWILKDIETSK